MKGIVLLIYEPPNNRKVLFKYSYGATGVNNPDIQQQQIVLEQLYRKFPNLISEEYMAQHYARRGSLEENLYKDDQDQNYFGFSKAFFTELFFPKENIFKNSLFDLTVESNRFLSFPFYFEESSSQSKRQNKKDSKNMKSIHENHNNDESKQDDKNKQKPKTAYNYKAQALVREQNRESFVGKQSYKIFRMKQQAFENRVKTAGAKNALKQQILNESILCQHIRDIYESFYYMKSTLIKINRWVQFHINQMPNFNQLVFKNNQSASQFKGNLYQKAENIQVLPHQTLLLFNAKQTLQQLPDDCSPLLVNAIKILNPLKSLSQLCVEHGVAYSEIMKVARHFIFWNQAKIIYPITLKEVYVLSQNLDHVKCDITQKFNQKFYQFNKMTLDKINMVIFLLQHNIIEERCLYIVLKLPSVNKDLKAAQEKFFKIAYEILKREQRKSKSQELQKATSNTVSHRSSSLFITPKQTYQKLKAVYIEDYLDLVRHDQDTEFRLLERMYPFFTGEFNHHDIMMISNCNRGKLDRMLDKYSCVLEKFWLK